MRRILDIVKLSKVEACFLFVKIALFSSRYSGRCLENVEIDDSGEVW